MTNLMLNMESAEVKFWQEFLINHNYVPGELDGIFGYNKKKQPWIIRRIIDYLVMRLWMKK
ncbi:MAG: hypothetical protein NT007_00180 [Candidatus Kapabacteria bacterium]|nr:hypothetical protein [Candidatus Kapabacteria bacterium]